MKSRNHDLLMTYAGYLRRAGHIEASSIALRTRSERLRDVISYVATFDRYTFAELALCVRTRTELDFEFRPTWLATLGRVVALQAYQRSSVENFEDDIDFGLACLKIANRKIQKNNEHKQFHRLEVELFVEKGMVKQAAELIRSNEYLENYYYGYLYSDLQNPSITGTQATFAEWLHGFNKPFLENDLAPVYFKEERGCFDALNTAIDENIKSGPLVSVVMTCYRPNLSALVLATESILKQTWLNLELLIIDDASPGDFDETLKLVGELDSRIRVIKLSQNGGTYRARNIGLESARGEFVTGQDSDDWSHPERVAAQVEFLITNSDVPGVLVEAIRVDENLVRTFPGRLPQRPCEVSLMLRKELAEELGGYIDARKGADSEFRLRLEQYVQAQVGAIDKPLYLTRIGHESLSNADFKPGWSHPVRRSFWNASRYWHRNTPLCELRLEVSGRRPIPVPGRFKIDTPVRPAECDVVFVGDWRACSGAQRSLIDSIKGHLERAETVGVMHLESVISSSKETTVLCTEIQELIHRGSVTEIIPDEGARTPLVILNDPSILQFAASQATNLRASTCLVIAEISPDLSVDGTVLYQMKECDRIGRSLFGGDVVWTSADPLIWKRLVSFREEVRVTHRPVPIIFFPKEWEHNRPHLIHDRPIIARHSENFPELWPNSLQTIQALWPMTIESDVRILGDIRALYRKLNIPRLSTNWMIFQDKEVQPAAFMSGVDFYVYFPDESHEQTFSREALEAAAAGALVIMPKQFESVHGPSAIYAMPEEVQGLIQQYTIDKSKYARRSLSAQLYLQSLSWHENYNRFHTELRDGTVLT